MTRRIKQIVIHCTATPDYHPSDPAFDSFGVAQVRQWHTRPVSQGGRGWDDVGYHWVVRRTGKVEKGRPEGAPGAHVYGHNQDTLGIAYVGTKAPTAAQIDALRGLIADKVLEYKLPFSAVVGHCDLDPKKPLCPGVNVRETLLLGKLF